MLVLSRKAGERIHIGDDIFIEVRRVAGNRVTLAVNAPREVRVLRGELMEAAKSFEETQESCCTPQCCTNAANENREPQVETRSVQPEPIIVTHDHFVRADHFHSV